MVLVAHEAELPLCRKKDSRVNRSKSQVVSGGPVQSQIIGASPEVFLALDVPFWLIYKDLASYSLPTIMLTANLYSLGALFLPTPHLQDHFCLSLALNGCPAFVFSLMPVPGMPLLCDLISRSLKPSASPVGTGQRCLTQRLI